ncbi:hypothetical protein D9619_011670 [Psilocybe cf. subviscida]|uniref:NACHT domain-containing protein n=1 Tax=Psilocybe cf. subviscida TaxID=2480587 RepID=A0A8H5BSC1_9AGAR|nr:hypothetical protein D9619_011670 [Psilocybe cf. subviscida]
MSNTQPELLFARIGNFAKWLWTGSDAQDGATAIPPTVVLPFFPEPAAGQTSELEPQEPQTQSSTGEASTLVGTTPNSATGQSFEASPISSITEVVSAACSEIADSGLVEATPESLAPLQSVSKLPKSEPGPLKQGIGVTGRFAQTLLKRLPELIEPNPVKLAFSISKVILQMKDSIDSNSDAIEISVLHTSTRLSIVETVMNEGVPKGSDIAMTRFSHALAEGLERLERLRKASVAHRTFDYEESAKEIKKLFDHIDAATKDFQIELAIGIQRTANVIFENSKKEALQRLRPSENATYETVMADQAIRREQCTADTRVDILRQIETWANDTSVNSPFMFWLTGQAGSGKTTIATTIAARFGASDSYTLGVDTCTTLGENFFCSRQSPETRNPARVIPTIAYQLARRCESYASALVVGTELDCASFTVCKQIQSLLVTPWLKCEAGGRPTYLIVIDALDELSENGALGFLDDLFTVLNESPLKGIKLLLTSRSDPNIVNRVNSFPSKTESWLQCVPLKQVSSDIAKYLKSNLPRLNDEDIRRLEGLADGIFIHAATAV